MGGKHKQDVRKKDSKYESKKIKNEFGDINSKEIWKNALLCAQFLRGYAGVPLLEDVQPEDIEDITEALRPFVGVEYEGDTVKQIHLHGRNRDVYVVGLLEHKSDVDYDVTFQLLKYMVGIWTMFRNRENKEKENSSRNKEFRYPLIIPIVYYEGKENWTAHMHWSDRVEFAEHFGKYVPDFTYEVVRLRSYSDEELLSKEEELSLVMLLNRVQTEEDLNFGKWSEEQRTAVERILRNSSEDVLRILAQMVYHFGLKMNLPDAKLRRYVSNIKERDMGELWANMDHIDLPARLKELDERDEQLRERDEKLRERDEKLNERNEQLDEREEKLREKEGRLLRKSEELDARERLIEELQMEIARLKQQ